MIPFSYIEENEMAQNEVNVTQLEPSFEEASKRIKSIVIYSDRVIMYLIYPHQAVKITVSAKCICYMTKDGYITALPLDIDDVGLYDEEKVAFVFQIPNVKMFGFASTQHRYDKIKARKKPEVNN